VEPGRPRRLVIHPGWTQRGRRPRLAAAALLIGLAACSPRPVPVVTPTPESPTAPPVPASAATGSPAAVDPDSMRIHLLDPRFVPADAPISADGQLVWTAGEGPAEIWRYVPGAEQPEQVFVSRLADGAITAIAASRAGYLFVEESPSAYGKGGWRLWFLARAGQQPIEVDRGSAAGAGVAPTLAIDDQHVAWAAFDEPAGGPVSRLKVASVSDPQAATTLIEAPVLHRKLWYPTLSGSELWYATIEPDPKGIDDEFHVEHLDLTAPHAPPVVFRGPGHDFSPAVNGRFVAWKSTDPGDSALNWGELHAMDRSSGAIAAIPVAKANRPTMGDGFIAFDEITHTRVEVYDLSSGQIVELERAASGAPTYGGISLSGSLLGFFRQDAGAQPRIGWAILPE
jgi:hypothetical protein